MQIGCRYSTATPRMALMESRKPVDWISVSARLSQYERPEAMPMHSSSLQTRMSLNAGSREIGRSSPPLVTMSGTERMNSTPLALIAAMMVEPLSSTSSSSAVSKSASMYAPRCGETAAEYLSGIQTCPQRLQVGPGFCFAQRGPQNFGLQIEFIYGLQFASGLQHSHPRLL